MLQAHICREFAALLHCCKHVSRSRHPRLARIQPPARAVPSCHTKLLRFQVAPTESGTHGAAGAPLPCRSRACFTHFSRVLAVFQRLQLPKGFNEACAAPTQPPRRSLDPLIVAARGHLNALTCFMRNAKSKRRSGGAAAMNSRLSSTLCCTQRTRTREIRALSLQHTLAHIVPHAFFMLLHARAHGTRRQTRPQPLGLGALQRGAEFFVRATPLAPDPSAVLAAKYPAFPVPKSLFSLSARALLASLCSAHRSKGSARDILLVF